MKKIKNTFILMVFIWPVILALTIHFHLANKYPMFMLFYILLFNVFPGIKVSKYMKRNHPDIVKEEFKNYPWRDDFASIAFVFNNKYTEHDDIKRIKYYGRFYYIYMLLVFLSMPVVLMCFV